MRPRPLLILLALLVTVAGAVLAVGRVGPARAAAPTLVLVAPAGPQPPANTLALELRILDASNLGAFELDLVYDPAMVQVTGFTLGSFLGQTTSCTPMAGRCAIALGPRAQAGAIALGAYTTGTGAGPTGDGTLGVLHLRPTGRGGVTTLQITNARLTDVGATLSIPATRDATLVLQSRLFLPLVRR